MLLSIATVVVGVPFPHEYFDLASEDLTAVVGFFNDAETLCVNALQYSYDASATMTMNQTITVDYSEDALQQSEETIVRIQKKLSYSSDILDELQGKAGSYEYLKDVLLPLKDLGAQVSAFVENHSRVLENFTTITTLFTPGGNQTRVFQATADARFLIYLCRNALREIQGGSDGLSAWFPPGQLQELTGQLTQTMDSYDGYLSTLMLLLESDTPMILIYLVDTNVYLGENVTVYGVVTAERQFIKNQSVRILWDHSVVDTVLTDAAGRFECPIPVRLEYSPGAHTVSASTIYSQKVYTSNDVNLTVQKIPTFVSFFTPRTHYYLNESPVFTGRLSDYQNRSIMASLSLSFSDGTLPLATDENGRFTYEYTTPLAFGSYPACVVFQPEQIYEPCISEVIDIFINTPTVLTLTVSQTDLRLGDSFQVSGWLTSRVDGAPLAQKTIRVLLNTQTILETQTNETGYYHATYTTENLQEGSYQLQTRYTSDENKWRDTQSPMVSLQVTPAVLSPFVAAGIIVLILGITSAIYLLRKRLTNVIQPETPRSPMSISTPSRIPRSPVSARIQDYLIDSSMGSGTLKNALVSRYRLLIALLMSKGMMIGLSDTHQDIKQTMIAQGLPSKATELVTVLFEQAMYAPYPLQKRDVNRFNTNMSVLVEQYGVI